MTPPPAILHTTDPAEDVMKHFDDTGAQALPVLNEDGELLGYISRTHMYASYREIVADLSEE